jgi:hypothetical protein
MQLLRYWRYRIGWWLLAPIWFERLTYARERWESGHQPGSYHKDWWVGQWFGLMGLKDRVRQEKP